MSKIIIPEVARLKHEAATVTGLTPEMIEILSRLRDQISTMLNYPMPMKAIGPKEKWTNLSDRYDIIIGDFGIKDLSVKAPFKPAPQNWPSISLPAPTLLPKPDPQNPMVQENHNYKTMSQELTDIYSFKEKLVPQPKYGGRLGLLICVDDMMSKEAIRRVHRHFTCAFSALENEHIFYYEAISGDEIYFCGTIGADTEKVDNRRRNKYLLLFRTDPTRLLLGRGVDASSDILEILLQRYHPEMDGRNEARVV